MIPGWSTSAFRRSSAVQHLQSDVAVVLEVAGEINGGHPAPPQYALQHVSVAECLGERM
jgi:hypothetical protein